MGCERVNEKSIFKFKTFWLEGPNYKQVKRQEDEKEKDKCNKSEKIRNRGRIVENCRNSGITG